jgi:ribonuclease PH
VAVLKIVQKAYGTKMCPLLVSGSFKTNRLIGGKRPRQVIQIKVYVIQFYGGTQLRHIHRSAELTR